MAVEADENWNPAPPAPRFETRSGPEPKKPGESRRPFRYNGGFSVSYRMDLPEGDGGQFIAGGERPANLGGILIDTVEAFITAVQYNRKFFIAGSGRELKLTTGQIMGMRMSEGLISVLMGKGYIYSDGKHGYRIDFEAIERDSE